MARILIVEDEGGLATNLARALAQVGHLVTIATNSAQGLQVGIATNPDVLVADWMLRSRLHGGEVAQRIRSACPHTRVIIISGYFDGLDIAQSEFGDSIDHVLAKPFRLNVLTNAVDRVLGSEFEHSP